jgi:hypothetical protein
MNKFIGIFILSVFFLSCSSNLDFNQVNDFKSEPIVVANLASFDVQANQFVVGGAEQPVSGDLMDFNVFTNTNFNDSLTRVDLFFEITNTINRAYVINLYFLDANNAKVYTIPFTLPAYTAGQTPVTKNVIFENANLDLLKKTKKIAFVINLLPGTAITSSSLGSLKLRSSATLYLVEQ